MEDVEKPELQAETAAEQAMQPDEHGQTVERLRMREAAYHRLFESMSDSVFMLKRDAEQALTIEPVGQHTTATRKELSALLLAEQVAERYRQARETGASVTFNETFELSGGAQVRSICLVPLEEDGVVLGVMRDVSETYQTRQILRETGHLFRRLFEVLPDAAVIVDEAGKVRYINRAGVALIGAEKEEDLVGQSVWDFVHQETTGTAQEHNGQSGDGPAGDFVEKEVVRLDGRVLPVEVASVPILYQGDRAVLLAVRDLSGRKRMEQALSERRRAMEAERESRSLLYRIFYASPAPISIMRLSDGMLIDVNDEWCAFTGYERDEVVGHENGALSLWVDPEKRKQFLSMMERQALIHDYEMEVRTRQGAVRTGLCSVQKIQVEGDPCLLSVINDITERKEAEAKLREAKEHAEEMAQLKSNFLTNLTHEIRTPLTVILGFTSMLRQGVRKEYARFVHLIERSGRRLLLMLDSLLDLAQLEAGTLDVVCRPYNLNDMVHSVTSALLPLAEERGLVLEVDIPGERIYAQVDHGVLTRVLNNLLDNAIKFTDKGSIGIALQERKGDQICLTIHDTGVGIDEKFLPQIFEPFLQESTGLERTHQGSGLGLAVSKRLIELMGGEISVQSSKGAGSIFTIILPRARQLSSA